MPSSYRVIKNNSVTEKQEKVIITDFEQIRERAVSEGHARTFMDSYESLSKSMIENARNESREILLKAYEEADAATQSAKHNAESTYKEAYEKGYAEGSEKGYKDAYEDGYKRNIEAAANEAEFIKKNAENILFQARREYDEYLVSKENEIRDMIVDICKGVLKREVKEAEALNSMVRCAISEIKGCQTLIIKCHSNRYLSIKNEIESWRKQSAYNGDLFVLEDAALEEDSVVIEKENGKIVTGIEAALSKVKEIAYYKSK